MIEIQRIPTTKKKKKKKKEKNGNTATNFYLSASRARQFQHSLLTSSRDVKSFSREQGHNRVPCRGILDFANQRRFLDSPRFHEHNSCTAVCPPDLYAMVGAATIMATGLRSRVLYHRVEMACVGSPLSWIIRIVVRHHLLEDR